MTDFNRKPNNRGFVDEDQKKRREPRGIRIPRRDEVPREPDEDGITTGKLYSTYREDNDDESEIGANGRESNSNR